MTRPPDEPSVTPTGGVAEYEAFLRATAEAASRSPAPPPGVKDEDVQGEGMMSGKKTYLGDAVYVSFDGYILWLTTEDGYSATNTIALEPPVYEALVRYVARITAPLAGTPIDREQNA